jgi:PAS domain S-box-containing protein
VGRSILDLFPEKDRKRIRRRVISAVLRKGRHQVETEMLGRDGKPFFAQMFLSALKDPGGKINGLVGYCTDVTERREAEQALRESEARFRKAFDASPGLFAISSPEKGIHIEVNEAWLKAMGYRREEVIGRSASELGIWVDKDDRRRVIERLKRDGSVRNFDTRFRTRAGEVLNVLVAGEVIELDGERRLLWVAHDVTELKKVEEELRAAHDQLELRVRERTEALESEIAERRYTETALRDSEERFRDFAETAADWFWETDRDMRLTYISRQSPGIDGKGRETLLGKTRFDIADTTDDPEKWRRHREDLEARRPFRGFRYRVVGRAGTVRYISVSGKPFVDDKGRFLGYRGASTDVTDRVRAEQELRDAVSEAQLASRAKSEFLANMSHELRTPLNAIIGFSDVIKREVFGGLGSSRYLDYVNDIHDSGTHLLDLINDVLDVSRVEAGALEVHDDELDPAEVSRACLRLVKERAARNGVKLAISVGKNIPRLRADERRLKQILLNLLSNAVKFTPRGGRVRLSVLRERQGGVVFKIADTGIGMSEQGIATAMAPFGQIDGTDARRHDGTGLGLPLTQGLLDAHGGTLTIASKPGVGTTVRAVFPKERAIAGD